MSKSTITIPRLKLGYANTIVLSASKVSIDGPALVGLVGANGAGKTTLLQAMAGLLHPTEGVVKFNKHDVHEPSVRSRMIFVPDRPVLFNDLAIVDTLNHVLKLTGASEPTPLGGSLWEAFELDPLKRRFPSQLSRGQRQKAALAIALSRPAEVLLLDEPTIALDSGARTALAEVLQKYSHDYLIIASSHDDDIIQAADVIARIDDGVLAIDE